MDPIRLIAGLASAVSPSATMRRSIRRLRKILLNFLKMNPIIALRKWLYKIHYIHYLEKTAWTYALEAELEEKKELAENYQRRDNIVADSEGKLKLLEENKTKLAECKDKETYQTVKKEVDALNAEIESNRIAKEGMEKQYISGLIKSIATKRQQCADSLAKAKACRKLKI